VVCVVVLIVTTSAAFCCDWNLSREQCRILRKILRVSTTHKIVRAERADPWNEKHLDIFISVDLNKRLVDNKTQVSILC